MTTTLNTISIVTLNIEIASMKEAIKALRAEVQKLNAMLPDAYDAGPITPEAWVSITPEAMQNIATPTTLPPCNGMTAKAIADGTDFVIKDGVKYIYQASSPNAGGLPQWCPVDLVDELASTTEAWNTLAREQKHKVESRATPEHHAEQMQVLAETASIKMGEAEPAKEQRDLTAYQDAIKKLDGWT